MVLERAGEHMFMENAFTKKRFDAFYVREFSKNEIQT